VQLLGPLAAADAGIGQQKFVECRELPACSAPLSPQAQQKPQLPPMFGGLGTRQRPGDDALHECHSVLHSLVRVTQDRAWRGRATATGSSDRGGTDGGRWAIVRAT